MDVSVCLPVSQSVKTMSAWERARMTKKCVHKRGGFCTIHGKQAEKAFRPISVEVVGEDGVKKMKTVRKTVWRCDLSGMRQTQMTNFLVSSPVMTAGRIKDTAQGDHSLMNFTAGQNNDYVQARTAENMLDKKHVLRDEN